MAAAGALLATGLLHVLLLGAPRPLSLFVWITGLAVIIIIATAPFSQPAMLSSKVFTAIINVVAGAAVISLLTGVARSAVRAPSPTAPVVPPKSPPGLKGATECQGRRPGRNSGHQTRAGWMSPDNFHAVRPGRAPHPLTG